MLSSGEGCNKPGCCLPRPETHPYPNFLKNLKKSEWSFSFPLGRYNMHVLFPGMHGFLCVCFKEKALEVGPRSSHLKPTPPSPHLHRGFPPIPPRSKMMLSPFPSTRFPAPRYVSAAPRHASVACSSPTPWSPPRPGFSSASVPFPDPALYILSSWSEDPRRIPPILPGHAAGRWAIDFPGGEEVHGHRDRPEPPRDPRCRRASVHRGESITGRPPGSWPGPQRARCRRRRRRHRAATLEPKLGAVGGKVEGRPGPSAQPRSPPSQHERGGASNEAANREWRRQTLPCR